MNRKLIGYKNGLEPWSYAVKSANLDYKIAAPCGSKDAARKTWLLSLERLDRAKARVKQFQDMLASDQHITAKAKLCFDNEVTQAAYNQALIELRAAIDWNNNAAIALQIYNSRMAK